MYKDKKMIVGLDLAGDERIVLEENSHVHLAFDLARKNGVQRTIHAGESTSAHEIIRAIELCDVQRIGHGQRMFVKRDQSDDENVMAKARDLVLARGIHIEMCPRSSILLQSVTDADLQLHPLALAVQGGFSVGINTDDPGLFCTTLIDDYNDATAMGITDLECQRKMNIDAMKNSFAEQEIKDLIIKKIVSK